MRSTSGRTQKTTTEVLSSRSTGPVSLLPANQAVGNLRREYGRIRVDGAFWQRACRSRLVLTKSRQLTRRALV